jgi:hypothetical protein
VRHLAEIVNVKNRAMHHDGILAYLNTVWAGMQISALIKINTMAQADVICEAQSDPILDCCPSVHPQYQPIQEPPQGNTSQRGHPADQQKERLL